MRVLGDKAIEKYLAGLTRDDLEEYQEVLVEALKSYNADNSLIPHRIVSTTPLATHLFMPGLGASVGMKVLTGSAQGFTGVTLIISPETGDLLGVLNARNLTAFRTALATSLGLTKFFGPEDAGEQRQCIVFGTGLQAYWHIKLALLFYPKSIDKVVIANRTLENAQKLQHQLASEYPQLQFEAKLSSECEEDIDKSSIFFGCTPSTEPVIYYDWFKTPRRRFLGLIGSYKPHMQEIDPVLVQHVTEGPAGKIVVDSIDHVMHEAGEIIMNNVPREKLMSITDLPQPADYKAKDILVYKLVGLSIMDTSVGARLLARSGAAGIGHVIDDF